MTAPLLDFPQRILARRRPPADHEAVLDSFAGFGGWGLGEEHATGWAVDYAINHNELAIAAHKINHPATHHFCTSVWEIDPRSVDPGRPFAHCHFSPDCTDFSKAKGGTPVSDRVRGLAWVVLPWLFHRRPRVVTLENVEEFQQWGPTHRGRPIASRRGETFSAFLACLTTGLAAGHPAWLEIQQVIGHLGVPAEALQKGLRYKVEYRELLAADYGAPTARNRFFLVGRCDGDAIAWPPETHAPRKSAEVAAGDKLPHRMAAEFIDFDLACPSIFMNRRQSRAYKKATGRQVKRPLARKTLQRVAQGIKRFVIEAAEPFLVTCQHAGQHAPRGTSEPMRTLTASRDAHGLVVPFVTSTAYTKSTGRGKYIYPPSEPARTILSSNDKAIVAPVLSRFNGQKGNESRCEDARNPASTLDTSNRVAVVAPVFVQRYGERDGQEPRSKSVEEPASTVVPTGNGSSLVSACLVGAGGPVYSAKPSPVDRPAGTLIRENHKAVVSAFLAKHFGGVVGHGVAQPASTVTAVDHHSLVTAAFVSAAQHGGANRAADAPMHTITASTKDQNQVIASHLLHLRGTCKDGRRVDVPSPTVTGGGTHLAVISAILTTYYGSGKNAQQVTQPCATITATERLAVAQAIAAPMGPEAVAGFLRVWNFLRRHLGKDAPMPVVIVGPPEAEEIFLIIDIGMRMLIPRELLGLQFGELSHGWVLLGTKEQQTAGIGNSVCPHVSRAIVKANVRIRRAGVPRFEEVA